MQKIKTDWILLSGYLSLSLLAAMWLLPFVYLVHKYPIVSYHSEWWAVLLGLLSALAGLPVLFRDTLRLPRITLLPLALAAFLGLQPLLLPQVFKQHAQLGMAYLFWAALVMTLVYNLRRTFTLTTIIQALATALLLGALVVSGLEFWLRFRLGQAGHWGGMTQANSYSNYLSLGLASALYLHAKRNKGRPWLTIALAVCAAVLVVALSLSTSRSIWFYLLALVALAGVSSFQQKRGLLISVALATALFALMQLVWSLDWGPTTATHIETSGERFVQHVGGTPIRLHIWQVAWQLFLQAPWLGQGFGQFDWAYFTAGEPLPEIPGRVDNAHNLIMQLLAEQGLLPVLILVAGLGFWLAGFLKAQLSLEGWWLLALLAVLGIHSLLEYPLWYSYFLGIAAVLLGLGEQKAYDLEVNRVGQWALGLALVVLIGFCINHNNSYTRMENMMYAVEHDHVKPSKSAFVAAMKQVSEDTPTLAPYVAVVFTLIDQRKDGPIDNLVVLGDTSVHFMPTSELAYRHVLLLALADKREESATLLRQTLKAYPAGSAGVVKDLQASSPEVQQKTTLLVDIVEAQRHD